MLITSQYDPAQRLNLVYILLGPACNMNCRHCSQLPIKSYELSTICTERVLDWLKSISCIGNKRIYFWGGEPLLYLQQIIGIVENLTNYNLNFAMTSNGLLLSKDIANWMNAKDIEYVLSYDAPNPTAMRSAEPSSDNCNVFLSLHKRKLCTVTSGINCNIESSITWLEKKFPNTPIISGLMQIMSDIPSDTYNFDFNNCRIGLEISAQKLVSGQDVYGNRRSFWIQTIGRLRTFIDYKSVVFEQLKGTPRPTCGSGQQTMSIDLDGNVYPCHNSNIIVGNIDDDPNILWQKTNDVWRKLIPINCFTCEHLDICQTRCAVAQKTPDGTEYTQCSKFLKKYWEMCKEVTYRYNLFDYI